MKNSDDYAVIPPDQLINYTENKIVSSHCVIFARLPGKTVLGRESCPAVGAVMMQMRFDGKLGFAGGLTDEKESPENAVNREMHEEVNLDLTRHKVEQKDHVVSHYNKIKDSVHHFYSLEVTEGDLRTIEQRSLLAEDYGNEVMGILRVPLFTRQDGVTGFPTFLTNKFAGCSYLQLLAFLKKTNLLSLKEIEAAEQTAASIP